MQRQTVSVERWAAIRQLREGEPPTVARLAAIAKLHPRTIYEHAAVEGWVKQPFQSSAKRGTAGRGEPEADAQHEGGEKAVPEGWHEMSAAERLQWLNDFAMNKVAEIAMSAEADGGVPNKGKLDAVWSMLRTVDRSETLAQERAAEKVMGNDADLGERLRNIDDRIIELAEAHAEWLVAERDRGPVG